MERKTSYFKYFMLITYGVLLYLAASHLWELGDALKWIMNILTPVLIGLAIAFVLNLPLRFLENKLLTGVWKRSRFLAKHKRGVCVALAYLLAILFIVVLMNFIVPQFMDSMAGLFNQLPTYVDDLGRIANDFYHRDWSFIPQDITDSLLSSGQEIAQSLRKAGTDAIQAAVGYTISVTTSIIDFFLGLFFSIYMLASKEKLIAILKRLNQAFIPPKAAQWVSGVATQSNDVFARFIGGQMIEACILGSLCCIGMLILGLSYAPLISCVIGVTSLIPVLGAYLGVIPAIIILLLEEPLQALIFIVFIVILQQFEGNVIYPRVVGGAIGLGGFWVLLAITVGGSMFGVLGMLLGVPTMAVIYTVVRDITNRHLAKKEQMSSEA